jgi:hypothetical protein
MHWRSELEIGIRRPEFLCLDGLGIDGRNLHSTKSHSAYCPQPVPNAKPSTSVLGGNCHHLLLQSRIARMSPPRPCPWPPACGSSGGQDAARGERSRRSSRRGLGVDGAGTPTKGGAYLRWALPRASGAAFSGKSRAAQVSSAGRRGRLRRGEGAVLVASALVYLRRGEGAVLVASAVARLQRGDGVVLVASVPKSDAPLPSRPHRGPVPPRAASHSPLPSLRRQAVLPLCSKGGGLDGMEWRTQQQIPISCSRTSKQELILTDILWFWKWMQ